jgi:hypothetical protein
MRILIAGLIGGIAMFVWSSIAHIATPLGLVGVSTLPNESATVATIAGAVDKGGLYLFPMNMAEEQASAATGPGGMLIYNPHAAMGMEPKNLIIEFVTELAEALLAAWLLSMTAIAGYGMRVAFVTGIGVVGAIATNVPYWNWYTFPLDYTLAAMFVTIVAFFVAGLAMAWWLKANTTA